jgi:hypothetical protein
MDTNRSVLLFIIKYIFMNSLTIKTGILAIALSTVLLATMVSAQNSTGEPAQEIKTRLEEKMRLPKSVQDRVVNLASNVNARLAKADERMSNIIGRLESRIAKLEAQGIDVSTAKETLSQAKNTQEAAQATLRDLASVQRAVSGEAPRETFNQIKIQFLAAKDLIRQTHRLLIQTVAELKESIRKAEAEKGVSGAVRNTGEASNN